MRIEHDQRTRFGVVVFHRRLQFPIGRKLQPEIETHRDVLAEIRQVEESEFLDRAPVIVEQHPLAARLPLEERVKCVLDTFLADIVDVRHADEVRRGFCGGIEPPVLGKRSHASNAQIPDCPGSLRTDLSPEVGESLPRCRDATFEHFGRYLQDLAKLRQLPVGKCRLAWIDPDRVDGRADGQQFPAPVVDDPPMRRYAHRAHGNGLAALLEEIPPLGHAQVSDARKQPGDRDREERNEHVVAPLHCRIQVTSSGKCMDSASFAIRSTFRYDESVPRSSNRRLYSSSRASRRACSSLNRV